MLRAGVVLESTMRPAIIMLAGGGANKAKPKTSNLAVLGCPAAHEVGSAPFREIQRRVPAVQLDETCCAARTQALSPSGPSYQPEKPISSVSPLAGSRQ